MKETERAGYESLVNEQAVVLQHTACMAMSALLLGPCWDNSLTDAGSATFSWINSMFQKTDKLRKIGRAALLSFMQGNIIHPEFMNIVVNQVHLTTVLAMVLTFP